ncbi:MAG: type 4a pilus biogenesis protein PilO [Acidobacteria bacterium]|nr:type 4a pilus biogenesis protein PilO [Acidobacteriota bacterium]
MTDMLRGLAVLRRAVAEHRRLVIVLGAALLVNALVYGLVVYPLADRVANVTERDQAAEGALAEARADHAQASGTLTGKSRAAAELTTFYREVLPQDLPGARRLTYLRLAQLARESDLEYRRATYSPVVDTGSTLTRLQIQMVLSGTYADMRAFIYQLETAAEFVVIDNVQLAEGADGNASLVVTLDLSTYFRGPAQ